jgi:hypothetical protein
MNSTERPVQFVTAPDPPIARTKRWDVGPVNNRPAAGR